MTEKSANQEGDPKNSSKRSKVSQTDIPFYPLNEALRLPQAIIENYAGKPTEPFKIAQVMRLLPNSTRFRMLSGAATAYGLTDGGYRLDKISITALAKSILEAVSDADERKARRQALFKTRVFREFLQHYDGSPLPPKPDAAYVILSDLGVPQDRLATVYSSILADSEAVGFLQTIKNKKYVMLDSPSDKEVDTEADDPSIAPDEIEQVVRTEDGNRDAIENLPSPAEHAKTKLDNIQTTLRSSQEDDTRRRKVFVTHGKNKAFLDLIKRLLTFGELEPVISIERQSVSEPVPDKVMNEMRACGAAIIHVDADRKLMDDTAKEYVLINENVLIEIGAAMALYGRRFILLVKEGVALPSNLQGLYEVRYSGDSLDGDTTFKLLEAITQMKKTDSIT